MMNHYTKDDTVRIETIVTATRNTAAECHSPGMLRTGSPVKHKRLNQAWHRVWRKSGFPADFKLMYNLIHKGVK